MGDRAITNLEITGVSSNVVYRSDDNSRTSFAPTVMAEGPKYAYIGTWCMPSRATLLTGHHQHRVESVRMVGKYPGSEYNPDECPFWPGVFRKHGDQTAHIGKWH